MLKQYKQCWKVVLVQLCLAWRYWIPAPQNRDQPIGAWSQHGLWHVTCQPRLVQLVASPPCVVNLLVPQYTSCHSQGTGYQNTKISKQHSNIATSTSSTNHQNLSQTPEWTNRLWKCLDACTPWARIKSCLLYSPERDGPNLRCGCPIHRTSDTVIQCTVNVQLTTSGA